MRRINLSLTVLIVICFSTLFAQEYKIEDFLPDSLTTWQIYGSGNLEGNYSDLRDDDTKDYDYSFQINPQVNFSFKRIRPKTENILFVNGRFLKDNHENSDDYRKNNSISLSSNFTSKYYWKYNFGAGLNIQTQINSSRIKENEDYYTIFDRENGYLDLTRTGKTERKDQMNRINLAPGLFYGRVYDGEYGAKAMELVAELKKSGLLNRELTNAEFQELSQIILNRKAIYHYDSRIKKLDALNEITAYLKEIGAISRESHESAFVIEDIYSYSFMDDFENPRKFGYSLYFNLIGEFRTINSERIHEGNTIEYFYDWDSFTKTLEEKYYSKTGFDNTTKAYIKGINLGLSYNKIYNWNLYSTFIVDYLYQSQSNDYENIYKSKRDDFLIDVLSYDSKTTRNIDADIATNRFDIQYTVSYKLNSRSIFSLMNQYRYNSSKQITKSDDYSFDKTTEKNISQGLSFVPSTQYYITPKFRVSAGVIFDWAYYRDKNKEYYDDYTNRNNYYFKRNTTTAFLRFGYYF